MTDRTKALKGAVAFRFEELEDGIGVLTFDIPGQKVNTFGRPVVAELGRWIEKLEDMKLRGLLFRSGKPGQFIAGADLRELAALGYATAAHDTVDQPDPGSTGHEVFQKIGLLPFPSVALIDGASMGGGTEMALAMDYRIASRNKKTTIGFPEVKVGIIPGWGGTQRLPRIIGVHYAIEMICSGDPINAERAESLGLVFDAVDAERLVEEGCRLIMRVSESNEWKDVRVRMQQPLGMTENQIEFAFGVAEGHIQAKTRGQYPAPVIALRTIREGINLPLSDGLQIEREAFQSLAGTTVSANLIAVFFSSSRLARDPGVDNPDVVPGKVNQVGVLGAGLMGSGIATAHARSGIPSAMVDVDDTRIADGMRRAQQVISSRMKVGKARQEDMNRMLAFLSASISTSAFGGCDVVIEAVTENEELKTKIYGQLSAVVAEQAILASNTSTISITRMAESWRHPERFVGMHFFYPVDRMPLVEVVRGEKTTDETVATIVALSKRIRKTPIVVGDCPGFLVNRMLMPYMNESLVMLMEGASMDKIDKAATRWGMPMGPIALHDFVGLDTCCFAGGVMRKGYRDRTVETPILETLVELGRLGRKSGAGLRRFVRGKPVSDPEVESILETHRTDHRQIEEDEIQDRLFLSMLLEATRALEEDIVRTPDDLDMGLILGIGFPSFRGGILRWCDTEGAAPTLGRIERYSSLGKRFQPTELLKGIAGSNRRFYALPKKGR